MAVPNGSFKPALIVVDMQNDFCPPYELQHGSLAVPGGRDIAPLINDLLALPGFVMRVSTQDWHPMSHISFAGNHPGPNNKPFESYVDVKNWVTGKEDETTKQRLWPVHCVQGTEGAEIIDEIDQSKIDLRVKKGMDERVEMYSVFADSFGNMTGGEGGVSHDLTRLLKEKETTDVFVVGLAGDYCVKYTAIDAAKAGFRTYVVEEGTKCVSLDDWSVAKDQLQSSKVRPVSQNGEEIQRVRQLG